jgi:hypothetical protein
MVIAKGCPRCRGDLAYVDDIGDAYYSCVQCGHVVYRLSPALASHADVEERKLPTALPREEVHRRRIRKQLAARRQSSAA